MVGSGHLLRRPQRLGSLFPRAAGRQVFFVTSSLRISVGPARDLAGRMERRRRPQHHALGADGWRAAAGWARTRDGDLKRWPRSRQRRYLRPRRRVVGGAKAAERPRSEERRVGKEW